MAAFDERSDTLPLRDAARRLGYSASAAYERAHDPDDNGDLWLVPGHVRILPIGGRYRVSKAQVEAVLAPVAS